MTVLPKIVAAVAVRTNCNPFSPLLNESSPLIFFINVLH